MQCILYTCIHICHMQNHIQHINLNFATHVSRKRFCFTTEPRSGLAKVVVVGFSDSYVFRVFFKVHSGSV